MRRQLGGAGLVVGAVLAAGLVLAAEGGMDLSGWDWSAVEDTKPETPTREAAKAPEPAAEEPRVGATAAPDFDAEPVEVQAIFAQAPSFKVIPSQKDQDMYPCKNCHAWAKSDPTPRELKAPHDNFTLEHGLHGKGKFWCFTCHHLEGDGGLVTLEGEKVDFDHAYVVCSQCHVDQARDWVHGIHGKRVGSWQGERQMLNCTACHYQHRPRHETREPMAGPRMRAGLEDKDFGHGEHGHGPRHFPAWLEDPTKVGHRRLAEQPPAELDHDG